MVNVHGYRLHFFGKGGNQSMHSPALGEGEKECQTLFRFGFTTVFRAGTPVNSLGSPQLRGYRLHLRSYKCVANFLAVEVFGSLIHANITQTWFK